MKSRGGLGREVRELPAPLFPLSPLLLPRFYFFALPFTLHRSPLSERPLSERLEQANHATAGGFVYLGRMQIHFLSDVSSAIASSDRKVTITVTRHILVYIAHTLLV